MPRLAIVAAVLGLAVSGAGPVAAQSFDVALTPVEDLKAVFATVESVDTVTARARIGGTIDGITIDEGDTVAAGALLGTVRDESLVQTLAALDARVAALESQLDQARTDLERAERLRATGTVPQASLDDARTAVNVVTSQLAAARAEREATAERIGQGEIRAPEAGRVLDVQAVDGTVLLPGEPLATLAAERYVLRLYLPERHARFIAEGDPVLVGSGPMEPEETEDLREGRIRQVYPRLDRGRVVADADVAGLGDFFVGERIRVHVAAGTREAVVIPRAYVFSRFGLDYVRLEDGREVVVRTGLPVSVDGIEAPIEILSGLRAGDVIVPPSPDA